MRALLFGLFATHALFGQGLLSSPIAAGGGSGSGSGSTIAGTANKITASGVCDGTTGTCTLTIPTGVVLVAPVLGTPASGNLANTLGLPCAAMPALTGDTTTSAGACSATTAKVNGIAYSATAAAHSVEVVTSANTTATAKVVPDCQDTGGNHINFTQSTDAFSCGTSGGSSGGTAGAPLFVQTASSSAVTAASETTLIGAGAGSLTIPAAWFTAAGTVMDACASGLITTAAVPGTVRFKLKFGSTVIADTGAVTPLVSVTNGIYETCLRLTARTIGASGTIMVANILPMTGATLTPGEVVFANPTPGTAVVVDTTATQVVDFTVTWGTGALNSITGLTFVIVGPGSAVSSVFGLTGAVPNLSGDVTSSGATTTVAKVNGIAYSATAAAHTVQVTTTANTTATAKAIPDCTDTSGKHLNFTQSTDAFSCGTGGDVPSFTGSLMWYPFLQQQPQLVSQASAGTFSGSAAAPIYRVLSYPVAQTVSSGWVEVTTAGASGKRAVVAFFDSSCNKITSSDLNFLADATGWIHPSASFTIPAGAYYYGWAVEDNATGLQSTAGASGETGQWYFRLGAGFAFTGSNAATGSGASFAMPTSCGTKTVDFNFKDLIVVAIP